MAAYFFDTSALVKRHVNETGSTWVRSLIRAKAGHRIYVARITAVEITSAITRRPRRAATVLGLRKAGDLRAGGGVGRLAPNT